MSKKKDRAPVLFLGHGNPMNAITTGPNTQKIRELGSLLPRPKALIAVSAHWQTVNTKILKKEKPETIYDFSGFPPQLSEVKYPASGAPELAQNVYNYLSKEHSVYLDEEWGFDHGIWTVLVHLFPKCQVPVIMLSLDKKKTLEEHFKLAKFLGSLRDQDYMIVGSGNVVHNLWMSDWENKDAPPLPWAKSFHDLVKKCLIDRDFDRLIHLERTHDSIDKLSVPTLEHYLPLIYAIGASSDREQVEILVDSYEHASISMLSFAFGL